MSYQGTPDPAEVFRRKVNEMLRKSGDPIGPIKYVVVGILTLYGLFSSFYTVEPDEQAVIIRLGKYSSTSDPGLHFKIPFGIDKNINIQTTRVKQKEFGHRSSNNGRGRTSYSRNDYSNESLMLTGDLNVADVEWVVQYKISDPYKYLFKSQDPIKNVNDVSKSIMRRVVGDMLVSEVLTTGKATIASEAKEFIQEVLNKYDIGIQVVSVKLQDVFPPEKVKPSYNEENQAKQEQEKLINEAEEAYNKVIPEAKGQAEKLVSEAKGYGKALINRAQGDAAKFISIYNEYRKAPTITRKRIYIETMESLFSGFKDLTIVDPKVKGLLPIFNSMSKGEIK